MLTTLPNPSRKLKPFEVVVLEAVASKLPPDVGRLFREQLSVVNKVQRLLEWNEINLYCMHWFKVRWPESLLFENRNEWHLATVNCAFGSTDIPITVWSIGGHVFSLESPVGLKKIASSKSVKVRSVEYHANET